MAGPVILAVKPGVVEPHRQSPSTAGRSRSTPDETRFVVRLPLKQTSRKGRFS
jgi:hypothetical protein